MSEFEGVVLSHTVMGGNRFCSHILITKDGQKYHHIRPHVNGNLPLTYGCTRYREKNERIYWQPGYTIHINGKVYLVPVSQVRPTHPEDKILDPKDVVLTTTNMACTDPRYLELIAPFRFQTIGDLFPGFSATAKGSPYLASQGAPFVRSVGYLFCKEVELYLDSGGKPRARISFERILWGNRKYMALYEFSVTDYLLSEKMKSGQILSPTFLQNAVVRFGLANPWVPDGSVMEERCYIMVTHVIHQDLC